MLIAKVSFSASADFFCSYECMYICAYVYTHSLTPSADKVCLPPRCTLSEF